MTIAIGFWSQELTPGKEEVVVPVTDLKISNVALGDALSDPNGRSTVKITYHAPAPHDPDDEDEDGEDEDEESGIKEVTTVLCSLTAGKFEHTATDIVLEKDEPYLFTIVGKNSVFLSGNYLDQAGVDNPPYDESGWMSSEDEDDLDGVDLDVDMGSEETDASRFEEVVEELSKNLKRAREHDTVNPDKEKSKMEKKNKKQKGQNGQAIAVTSSAKEGTETTKKGEEGSDKDGKKSEEKDKKKAEKDNKDEKKGEEKEKKEKKGKKDKSGEEAKPKPVEKELPGGLKYWDSTVGSGPAAKKGNKVSMRYIGKLQNGKIFDKNTQGKPFTFRLGQGEVIKGWDEGIVGMHVGGERKITIPAHMGYGKKGTDGIPPNSTLVFDVKLLEIK